MKIIDNLTDRKVQDDSETLKLTKEDFIFYDISKTHATEEDRKSIRERLTENGFESRVDGMLNGECINSTEGRPVLHHLLRDEAILSQVGKAIPESTDVVGKARTEIREELARISKFNQDFEEMRSVTGKPFDTIVNIGIGGSDLGPRMVTDALQFYSKGRRIFFISNVDPSDTIRTFKKINPETTLFIVVSKTFTTIETMENFKLALSLLKSKLQRDGNEICKKQFVAVSSNIEETQKYGIETVFKMWDFVGGRYSLWSAVGFSISLYIGFENYLKLLKGASIADQDFFSRRLESISAKLAVNELFYVERGFNSKCIVCYDSYLGQMYKYLQQAEMESNGKNGSRQMIIWGGVGTDVQHSFFQLLHQQEHGIYLEMLCPIKNLSELEEDEAITQNMKEVKSHQQLLFASCLAQTRSMLVGKESNEKDHYFAGDKPSVTILYSKLTPETLGALLAVYEHKIFVAGVYFGINSFDQFGVELGKALTKELVSELEGSSGAKLDESTSKLLSFIKGKK